MNEPSDSRSRKLRRILVHPGTWIPSTIGLLVIIVLIALPYGIRYGIERGLTDAGAQQVLVEDVDFNPFIGLLSVRGLQVRVDGKQTLLLSQASVSYALWPLFRRRIVIDDLSLHDAAFSVEQSPDGRWRFIGLAGPTPPAAPDKTPGKETAWAFVLRHAKVLNSRIRYSSAELSGTAQIDDGELTLAPRAGTGSGPATGDTRVHLDGSLHIEHARPGITAATQIGVDITASTGRTENCASPPLKG